VILNAEPQVIPVFIAGLGNDLPKQILGNWTGGEKVRIWFGEQIDLSAFYGKRGFASRAKTDRRPSHGKDRRPGRER
jgi:hypothetical protein